MLGKGLELLSVNGGRFEINQVLFTDDTALVADSEKLCSLSGRTGSALVWHSESRLFDPHSVQQVLRFVSCICTCNTWSLGDTSLCRVGGRVWPVNWIYRL